MDVKNNVRTELPSSFFFLKGETRWLRKKNVIWGSGKPY
nr:MAG TPA: hypothetical protein [Caudoviricetes sp.]